MSDSVPPSTSPGKSGKQKKKKERPENEKTERKNHSGTLTPKKPGTVGSEEKLGKKKKVKAKKGKVTAKRSALEQLDALLDNMTTAKAKKRAAQEEKDLKRKRRKQAFEEEVKRLEELSKSSNFATDDLKPGKAASMSHLHNTSKPMACEPSCCRLFAVRYDEDGLPIYTEEQLQMGKGGGTALCPFDCDCCFI